MARVQVFTNSASEMSPAIASEFGVTVIPDVVVFSPEEQYLNNVEIDPETFFKKLKGRKKLPTTSHPNAAQYMEAFSSARDCEEILCVALTSKMSGAYSTACTAARMLEEQGFATPITVYDSLQNCYALSIVAMEAAKLASEGKSVKEILPHLDVVRSKIGAYFVVESMDNFRKAGRVGAIRVLAADLLNVKPILMFRDGTVRDVGIVRGFPAAVENILERYHKQAQYGQELFVYHANREALAQQMKQRILEMDPDAKVRVEWIGAIIGAYTGEGCVGLAFHER